jgi:hypothetical protein
VVLLLNRFYIMVILFAMKLAHNVNDSDKCIHALFCSFVALFTLRVGIPVPEAKISTQWHGSFMLLMAM